MAPKNRPTSALSASAQPPHVPDNTGSSIHIMQSLQMASPRMTQEEAMELTINCLMKINKKLELKAVTLLFENIDKLEASPFRNYANGLADWRSGFVWKFIRDLKSRVQTWHLDDSNFSEMDVLTKSLHASITSISDFPMFVNLYGRLRDEFNTIKPISREQHRYIILFFDFVSDYDYTVNAPQAELTAEFENIVSTKNWNGQMKVLEGVRDMFFRIGKSMQEADAKGILKFLIGSTSSFVSAVRNDPSLPALVNTFERGLIETQPPRSVE